MDVFLSPQSPEALAYNYMSTESWFLFDSDHPSLTETLIAGSAAYQSLSRYLSGQDLFILPRNRYELRSILHRYAYDSIHNSISQSRSSLQKGGYTRICNLAEQSIAEVLNKDENSNVLLQLHHSPQENPFADGSGNNPPHTPAIRT